MPVAQLAIKTFLQNQVVTISEPYYFPLEIGNFPISVFPNAEGGI